MFSDISEYDFAQIFIYSKQEKIKKILNFDSLDTYVAVQILYKFIIKNKDEIWCGTTNKYDPLFDEIFFVRVMDVLKMAHLDGINLNTIPSINEPNVRFVA